MNTIRKVCAQLEMAWQYWNGPYGRGWKEVGWLIWGFRSSGMWRNIIVFIVLFPTCLRTKEFAFFYDSLVLEDGGAMVHRTSGTVHAATQRHIPSDVHLLEHRCENL